MRCVAIAIGSFAPDPCRFHLLLNYYMLSVLAIASIITIIVIIIIDVISVFAIGLFAPDPRLVPIRHDLRRHVLQRAFL